MLSLYIDLMIIGGENKMGIFNFKENRQKKLQDRVELLLTTMIDAVELTREQLDFGFNQEDFDYGRVVTVVNNPSITAMYNNSLEKYLTDFKSEINVERPYTFSNGQSDDAQKARDEFEGYLELRKEVEFGLVDEVISAQKLYDSTPEGTLEDNMLAAVTTLVDNGGVSFTTKPGVIYKQLANISDAFDRLEGAHIKLPEGVAQIREFVNNGESYSEIDSYTGPLSPEVVTRVRMSEIY